MDPPQYPWFMESFKGAVVSRLLVAAVAMLVLVGVLAAGALTPMSRSEAESLTSGFEELLSTAAANPAGIFLNNFLASLLMMVPAAGMALAAYIAYNTGLVIGAVSIVSNIPPALALTVPFITVYGFFEMFAYGFAVSESFYLAAAAVRRRFRAELRLFPVMLVVVVGLLAVAALLEWLLIAFFGSLLPR
jgi:hypothetical protein